MKSSMPLRRYLSLQFAVVAALPVVIIAVLVWLLLIPQIRARNAIKHAGLARAVAGQISAHLKGGERQLVALADFLARSGPLPAELMTDLLDAHCGSGDVFETIYIVSSPETVIRSVGLARSRRLTRGDLLGMDLTGLDFLAAAPNPTATTWSHTFLSTVSSRLAVALTVPLVRQVMVGEITLGRLSEFISLLPVESGLLTLVLDRQGRIVADSQRLRWGQHLDPSALPASHNEGPADNDSNAFKLDGQSYLGTVVDVQALGWKVLVAQPAMLAFKPIRDTFILIALGLGAALVLAMAVAWLQAGGLSALFRLYAQQAKRIARGEYELVWPASKTVEFGNLADNLQIMAATIRLREEQLEESERRYRNLFDEAPMMYVVAETRDDGLYITDVNKSLLERLGYRRRDVVGTLLVDHYAETSREEVLVKGGYRRTMTGEVQTVERQLLTRNGKAVPTIMRSIPESGPGDTIVGVRAMYLDTTDLKQAEEAVRRLRNYLSNIIDSMPSALVGVDVDGRVTQWNRTAAQSTGISPDVAHGKKIGDLMPWMAAEMDKVKESIRSRQVRQEQKRPRRSGQGTRYEDITIFPLVANGVEGAVIRVDDVSERVHLEEMMIQSEKMLSVGGLAAGMAHEINNPLAGMVQTATVMHNRLTNADLPANRQAAENAGITMEAIGAFMEDRGVVRMLETIKDSGRRAAGIVSNMLSFARKSENVVSSEKLDTLLDQVVDLLRTDYDMKKHYDFKQIQVVREYDKNVPPVPCEPSKIQQVFMNILKNGAEAMTGGEDEKISPAFFLRVQDDGDWVRVEIEDNGPGMDEATRRRIFEPFFTTKTAGQGTGLGMSVSYFIITEDHGGEMGAYAAQGGGTRFAIRLPKAGRSGS